MGSRDRLLCQLVNPPQPTYSRTEAIGKGLPKLAYSSATWSSPSCIPGQSQSRPSQARNPLIKSSETAPWGGQSCSVLDNCWARPLLDLHCSKPSFGSGSKQWPVLGLGHSLPTPAGRPTWVEDKGPQPRRGKQSQDVTRRRLEQSQGCSWPDAARQCRLRSPAKGPGQFSRSLGLLRQLEVASG